MSHGPNPRIVAPVLVLTLLAVGGWYLDSQRAESLSKLTGFFETQPIEVSSRIDGRVSDIRVREGDSAAAGAPLIILDSGPAVLDLRAKREAAAQAQANYLDMAAGPRPEDIAQQEAVVQELTAELKKLTDGPLPEEVDMARAQADAAEAAFRRVLAGPRPQEIAAARAAANAARAHLAASQRGLTREEKAEARDRRAAAVAAAQQADADAIRYQNLYVSEAVTRQQLDAAIAAKKEADANAADLEQAYLRAVRGTPPQELMEARQDFFQANAQLALLLAGSRAEDIASARGAMQAATDNYLLVKRGARTEDIDAARARLSQAQAQLEELKVGSRRYQMAAARASAAAAEASAESSAQDVAERVVRAPRAGIVDRILVADGDLVAAGTPIVRMDDPSDVWIRLYVPESDLAKIHIGLHASLAVDGITAPVDGVVESIAESGEFTPVNLQSPEERGNQVFAVRLRPANPETSGIKPGMYATLIRWGTP